jgi:serine/threonine protein phosphatase PrpC/CRP-like cAMP-binding protein
MSNTSTATAPKGPYVARGSELLFRTWGGTDLGRKRKKNEDFALNDPVNGLFIVADGMGGGVKGGEASRMAVEGIRSTLFNHMEVLRTFSSHPTKGNYQKVQELVHRAILGAHANIRAKARELNKGDYMGTTVTCLIICGRIGIVAHVGDSRLYRIRDNQVRQLTRDHSLVAERVRRGELTVEEAKSAPGKNVLLQALGVSARIDLDIGFVTLKPGDQFLICSDGLHNYLVQDEIVTVFQEKDGDRLIPRLIDCANQRGGKDNITAIAIRVSSPWDSVAATQLDMGNDMFSSLRMLSGITIKDSTLFLRSGELKSFIGAEVLVEEEKPIEGMYIVLEGRAQVSRQGIWMATYTEGDFFGEAALIYDNPTIPVTIRCEQEGLRALLIRKEKFQALMDEHPMVTHRILWNLFTELTVSQRDLIIRLTDSIRHQRKS